MAMCCPASLVDEVVDLVGGGRQRLLRITVAEDHGL